MKQRIQVAGVFVGVLLLFGTAAYGASQVGGANPKVVGSESTVGACSTLGSLSSIGGLSSPGCDTLGGRAYGLSISATVAGVPVISPTTTSDTGPFSTEQSGTYSPPCAVYGSPLIKASALCVGVTTANNSSTATASLASLQTTIAGIPAITLKLVQLQSNTSCGGSAGTSSIAYLAIGSTVVISKQTAEPPNTIISLAGITIILNQQTKVTGYTHGLTVNAVHIEVALSTLAHADIVAGSATSTIAGC